LLRQTVLIVAAFLSARNDAAVKLAMFGAGLVTAFVFFKFRTRTPPCMRRRPLAMAGPMQGQPAWVLAPHRAVF
jgi:hypothetical protein